MRYYKYLKDLFWQTIKYFRSANFIPWAIQVYEALPNNISYTEYENVLIILILLLYYQ